MKAKSSDQNQFKLFSQPLEKQLNPKHPLYILSQRMPWDVFNVNFATLYSHTGRPAKPIRFVLLEPTADAMCQEDFLGLKVSKKWF